ncbi:DUF892 family protein, partial [Escherichia coli]|nr:DUF892 family protein [Escherichia coli]MCM4746710.1 DUF892 family protein [Escherichia coli]
MNRIEHYHDWLRDAHAMEKQAEKMLESMASRIENYPELRSRIEQHISETKNQLSQLESILDRNNISRSVIKDSMSKMAAFGQSIGGIFPSDEIVKGSISGYVNRPGFPGECFICELRLPDHRFRWKHNKLFLLLPEEYGPAFP